MTNQKKIDPSTKTNKKKNKDFRRIYKGYNVLIYRNRLKNLEKPRKTAIRV